MTWGLVAVAGATLVGGAMSSNAASNAADTQVASADKATALQRDIFNKQVELNDPYRQMGLGAGNRLMTLLGLSAGPSATGLTGGTTTDASSAPTRDQLRASLLSKYTSGAEAPTYLGDGNSTSGSPGTVDEIGLNAEIDKEMAAQQAAQQGQAPSYGGDPTDPAFGSAMKDFSMADYQADPGYQFRLDQGNQALERSAAARGGLLSGRAMKDAMAYNSGQAGQEYANAFNRFQVNRSNKLNPLQSLMGVGQTGTGAMTTAAGNYGTSASNDIVGAGNAAASGIVGSANALTGAIGQGVSMYQQNALMNRLFPQGTSSFSSSPMSSTLYSNGSLGD